MCACCQEGPLWFLAVCPRWLECLSYKNSNHAADCLGQNPVLFSAVLNCSPSCHFSLHNAFTLCALQEWAAVFTFLDISCLASCTASGTLWHPICQQSLGRETTLGFHCLFFFLVYKSDFILFLTTHGKINSSKIFKNNVSW